MLLTDIMPLTEKEKRLNRCCFTGHEPEKLNVPEGIVKERLEQAIDKAIHSGKNIFICGMARGVDPWAGEAVLKCKNIDPTIRLICATPFVGFE